MTRLLPLLLLAVISAAAAAPMALPAPNPPMPPISSSPVDLFRNLLATNSVGRERWLSTKPAATRQYIEGKLREYELMPAPDREARLHALQLRWHMRYFMQLNPAERTPRLATLPEADRDLLRRQLGPWDILPPQLKKDVLENENVLRMVVASGNTNKIDNVFATMTPDQREELRQQHGRWNQLPADRKEQILARFNQFFELRDAEKNQVVVQLNETEREQMEKTLSRFGNLSKEEREQAMQGFKKFAELSPAEQASFLRTADRWKMMSESDRQLWRRVVASFKTKRTPPIPPTAQSSSEQRTLTASNY